jgi:hypothetical protein
MCRESTLPSPSERRKSIAVATRFVSTAFLTPIVDILAKPDSTMLPEIQSHVESRGSSYKPRTWYCRIWPNFEGPFLIIIKEYIFLVGLVHALLKLLGSLKNFVNTDV